MYLCHKKRGESYITEFALIQKAQKGDTEALEKLIDRYYDNIFSYLFRKVGSIELAEDLTQDVFIAVYKNLSTFDRNYEKAWISKIASNKCLDFLKSAKQRVQPAEEEMFLRLEDTRDTPEGAYLQKESKEYVYQVCQRLKEPYKTVATEHFYLEKTISQIAQEKGKNVKTIQTQVYRAKGMLKKTVKEERAICRR